VRIREFTLRLPIRLSAIDELTITILSDEAKSLVLGANIGGLTGAIEEWKLA
jgi:hypothetical protein